MKGLARIKHGTLKPTSQQTTPTALKDYFSISHQQTVGDYQIFDKYF